MDLRILDSPRLFLQDRLGALPQDAALEDYERQWEASGRELSAAVDRAGTPWLRMFDAQGERIDEVLMAGGYRTLLMRGYRAGVVWRPFSDASLETSFLLGYQTAFYDPGLYCPYTVSLATAIALDKYGSETLHSQYLDPLLRRDDKVWQGATWMTEIGGGSDLGARVETTARPDGELWRLNGDKYFASNVGAELAVVAARPQDAPDGVRGLALFLLPRLRRDGTLNYAIRRLKDKIGTRSVPTGEVELRDAEAHLLGTPETGIYQVLEVLNMSRTANSIASVALAQRALADAARFAAGREAFGRPVLEQPLLQRQIAERCRDLERALALAWATVRLFDEQWRAQPPYPERYHLFRLVAHLAKYWTAEFAARTAKWGMEVYAGLGVLAEYPAERHFREAMVLAIWEGTAHRQILDGLEVMTRKGAHRLLFAELADACAPEALQQLSGRIEKLLNQPLDDQERAAEALFAELAAFSAEALRKRLAESTA